MCCYKLMDLKVPTNQIESVVRNVLGIVRVEVEQQPKRAVAQTEYAEREMGDWADVVAGSEHATAHHVTATHWPDRSSQTLAVWWELGHLRAESQNRRAGIGMQSTDDPMLLRKANLDGRQPNIGQRDVVRPSPIERSWSTEPKESSRVQHSYGKQR